MTAAFAARRRRWVDDSVAHWHFDAPGGEKSAPDWRGKAADAAGREHDERGRFAAAAHAMAAAHPHPGPAPKPPALPDDPDLLGGIHNPKALAKSPELRAHAAAHDAHAAAHARHSVAGVARRLLAEPPPKPLPPPSARGGHARRALERVANARLDAALLGPKMAGHHAAVAAAHPDGAGALAAARAEAERRLAALEAEAEAHVAALPEKARRRAAAELAAKGYDPGETRDDSGRWSGSGAAASHLHAGAVRRWAGLARHVGSKAMAPARKAARKVYAGIERRYGQKNAKRILGAMAVGMAVPLPGASLLAAAPMVALAELHRQLRGAPVAGKGADVGDDDLTDDEVLDAAEAALRELFGGELPEGWDRKRASGAEKSAPVPPPFPARPLDSDDMPSPLAMELVCKSPGVIDRLPTEGLMGYARRARLETDDGLMMCRGTLSTGRLDRSRDVVLCKGLDLGNHRNHPIALLLHDPERPIGHNRHPRTRDYTVRLNPAGDRLTCETYFTQDFQVGEQAFLLAKAGLLNGLSIGFRPDPHLVKKGAGPDGRPCTVIGGGELMETSLVVFPDNPDCTVELAEVVAKGFHGKPLVRELREVLTPMLPVLKAWSAGWGAGTRRKAYGDPDAANPAPLDAGDAGPRMPAGAQALQGAYEWLTGHASFLEDASAVNEHPEVKQVLAKLQTDLAKMVTAVATAFNSAYPDMPNLDPGTGYAAPEPDPDATPDPDAGDAPPPDLDEDGDAVEGMDEDEREEYKAARRGLRRMVRKHAEALMARRKLAEAQREQVARVAGRLEERPGSRATAHWAVKELRQALASKSAGQPAGPASAAPELDLDAIEKALAPVAEKLDAQRAALAGITGKG